MIKNLPGEENQNLLDLFFGIPVKEWLSEVLVGTPRIGQLLTFHLIFHLKIFLFFYCNNFVFLKLCSLFSTKKVDGQSRVDSF